MDQEPRTLYSIMQARSDLIIEGMLAVLYPDAKSVLDLTYGRGAFWNERTRAGYIHVFNDLANPPGADSAYDFKHTPWADDAFDVVLFDPPYHTDMGRGKPSIMGSRYSTFPHLPALKEAVQRGITEAWRLSRLGLIYKHQDYIHASRRITMGRWAEDALGQEPYEIVHQIRTSKIHDPKWGRQLSAYRNFATYHAYRWDSQIHKRRKP